MYIALHTCARHMVEESLGITLEPGTWLLHSVFVPAVSGSYNVIVFQWHFATVTVAKWHYVTPLRIFITTAWSGWLLPVPKTVQPPSPWQWFLRSVACLSAQRNVLWDSCFIQCFSELSSLAHLGASHLATARALSCSSSYSCFQLTECDPSPAGYLRAIVTLRNGQCPKIPWICLILNKFHTLAPEHDCSVSSGKCRISSLKKSCSLLKLLTDFSAKCKSYYAIICLVFWNLISNHLVYLVTLC